MNRREFFGVIAAATSSLPLQGVAAETDLRSAAYDAWIYCLLLIETARMRAHATEFGPSARGGDGINAFINFRELATPAERLITGRNVDTLYSIAFIDLANGPAKVSLPATGGRYFSLHLMDMFTNSFAVLGTRTVGSGGGTFVLAGPGTDAPAGAIRAPTPWIWAFVRIGVNSPEDLDAARAIQEKIVLTADKARSLRAFAERDSGWSEYFSTASALLAENPSPATDVALLRGIAPLGLIASQKFDATKFTASEAHEIEIGVASAKTIVMAAHPRTPINGWVYPELNLGDYGQNYVLRARVALHGLAALPRQEAMYMHPVTPEGRMRFSVGAWRLNFPPNQLPPVDAFWSLTMYEATTQYQHFLTENPMHRYAISDRTKGLKRNPDGSLDIWISRQDPGNGRTDNWLPAPARGPYTMTLRAYLPKPDLLNGTYLLPPVVPA